MERSERGCVKGARKFIEERMGKERGTRARKTEAERIEFLQNDPLTGDVEPHRVFCKECDEWVDLAPKRKYVMANWNAHRKQKHKQRGSDK